MLAFSDPDIIRMAREYFVAVVGDDWYERRRKDAEGEFFRNVSTQAGRGSDDPGGGSTRQGIYCLTAAGKLLSFKNAGQSPGEMRKSLSHALAMWNQLPVGERQPGAVQVPEAKFDARFAHMPPPGGLIVNTYTRLLEKDAAGKIRVQEVKVNGVARAPQHDHVWLTESEWKALIPAQPHLGDKHAVPEAVARRIFQFHLADSTPGEPTGWSPEDIRSGSMTLTVTESTDARVKLHLEGSVLLATDPNTPIADRGYDARLLGTLSYDVAGKKVDRFDFVALGDCWGKQAICQERNYPHRLLGVAFELARGDTPADRVPPQAARWLQGYLRPSR